MSRREFKSQSKYDDDDKYDDDFEEEPQQSECTWNPIALEEVEIGERIGGGGVGIIYSGWYGDERVALKTLFDPRVDEKLKNEYMDELLVLSEVTGGNKVGGDGCLRQQHPNIVRFLGACMTPPNLFFVMELCDGSLFDLLHNHRFQYSEKQKVKMAMEVANAMNFLHTREPAIIHRDLKSLNLLMGQDGQLKLCDFGLVRTKNTTAGTPCYMAPELLNNRPFSRKVDVYAYGVLLSELFTGEIPFRGCDPQEIISLVSRGQRPSVPTYDCPHPIRKMMQDCWHRDPGRRPEFSEILEILNFEYDAIPERTHSEIASDYGGDALDGLMGLK